MYIYNPNTYNKSLINKKKLTPEIFLILQNKYRESVEYFFKKEFNFQKFDPFFKNIGCIPLADQDYNFYHKYSTLGSEFIYLRNNYHVEKLNVEEIEYIQKCILENTFLDEVFLSKTAMKVMMEEGKNIFYNYINLENSVPSKSFVFEFSYDPFEFSEIVQIRQVNELRNYIIKELKMVFKDRINVPIISILYTGSPDLYKITDRLSSKYL